MCRSIRQLRREGHRLPRSEARLAARQYVRKVSGFREPSAANAAAFERAIDSITEATDQLLDELTVRGRLLSPSEHE